MNDLKIYCRSDLGMRKGKLSSQSSHAACAQLLNAMEGHGQKRLLPYPAFQDLEMLIQAQALTIHPVANEQALREVLASTSEPSTIITDRGLTEFGGVPTVTTAAQGIFLPSPHKATPMSGADLIARQWYVFSKSKPLPKYHAARMAALGGLIMLHGLLTPPSTPGGCASLSLRDPALHGWLTAGFGKIGMGIKTDSDLEKLQAAFEQASIPIVHLELEGSRMLVIGPHFPEDVAQQIGRESEIYLSGTLTLL